MVVSIVEHEILKHSKDKVTINFNVDLLYPQLSQNYTSYHRISDISLYVLQYLAILVIVK